MEGFSTSRNSPGIPPPPPLVAYPQYAQLWYSCPEIVQYLTKRKTRHININNDCQYVCVCVCV